MSKAIPISAARDFAQKFDKDQVIVLSFSKVDGKTWVTTYGKTQEDCEQAAAGGNKLKKAMGWPDDLCQAKPARQVKRESVAALKAEIEELKAKLAKAEAAKVALADVALSYRDDLEATKR